MSPTNQAMRERREALVIEHMESENRHEFDVTMETFGHPRYELIATGDVYDGEAEVASYFDETRTAFPDQRNELIALHHSDDAVFVEAMLYGTHLGPYRGLPPTGRSFEMRFCAMFVFEDDAARLRARLLRRRHRPAPARDRPRPAHPPRPGGDRPQPSADGRPGAGAPAAAALSARRTAIAALALAAFAVPGGAGPAQACGCGIALESSVSDERALVVDNPGHERIVLSLDLAGDPGDARRWCCPSRACPRSRRSSMATRSPTSTRRRPRSRPARSAAARPTRAPRRPWTSSGARPSAAMTSPGWHPVRPAALNAWLRRNGYALPDGAEPILADYVDRGWRFVAIRLAPGEEGRLKPLDVSFATDAPVYPMRLEQLASSRSTSTLYTLADGARTVEGLRTAYAGSVADLSPPPPPELADLFAEGSEVTRLEATGACAGHASPMTSRSYRSPRPRWRSAPAPRIPTGRRSARSPPPWR